MPQPSTLSAAWQHAEVDQEAARQARRSLVDLVAASLAAVDHPDLAPVLARAELGTGTARTLGRPGGREAGTAALLGGTQAHLLDLDDVHAELRGHPSAVLWPALIALAADATPLSTLVEAMVIGVEVAARLGRELAEPSYPAGWHPTSIFGPLAAAAAGARLLGLDEQRSEIALGLAASQAGGLRAQFGTPGKALQAGLAARAGVDAVLWAGAGLRAWPRVLDDPVGYLHAFGAAPGALQRIIEGFGDPWRIVRPGLWFKAFPYCSAAMTIGDAAELVARQLRRAGVSTEQVQAVRLLQPAGRDAALLHRGPTTAEQGRFSSEYVTALWLTGRRPGLACFGPRPVDPELAGLIQITSRRPVTDRSGHWARVEVDTPMGEFAAEVDAPHGSPADPLTDAELLAKLRDCCPDWCDPEVIVDLIGDPRARVVDLWRASRGVGDERA